MIKSLVAVSALPKQSPVKSPVTSPIRLPMNVTPDPDVTAFSLIDNFIAVLTLTPSVTPDANSNESVELLFESELCSILALFPSCSGTVSYTHLTLPTNREV